MGFHAQFCCVSCSSGGKAVASELRVGEEWPEYSGQCRSHTLGVHSEQEGGDLVSSERFGKHSMSLYRETRYLEVQGIKERYNDHSGSRARNKQLYLRTKCRSSLWFSQQQTRQIISKHKWINIPQLTPRA